MHQNMKRKGPPVADAQQSASCGMAAIAVTSQREIEKRSRVPI